MVACLKGVVRVQGAELGRSIDGSEWSQKFYKPSHNTYLCGELSMEIPTLSEEEKQKNLGFSLDVEFSDKGCKMTISK